jgi:hypothetical protein
MIVKKSVAISKIIAKIQLVLGLFLFFGFYIAFVWKALDGIDDNNLIFVLFPILMVLGLGFSLASAWRFAIVDALKYLEESLVEDSQITIKELNDNKEMAEGREVKLIFWMFRFKYVNGFIDSEHSRFVFHMEGFDRILSYEGFSKNGKKIRVSQETASDSEVLEVIGEETVITCKNCGGINTIRKGSTSECEYCGSSIS